MTFDHLSNRRESFALVSRLRRVGPDKLCSDVKVPTHLPYPLTHTCYIWKKAVEGFSVLLSSVGSLHVRSTVADCTKARG